MLSSILEMAEDREVAVLVLGLAVAMFVSAHLPRIRTFPYWYLPVIAAGSLLTGWTLSTIEAFVDIPAADALEHSAYLGHSSLMCVWAFLLYRIGQRAQ